MADETAKALKTLAANVGRIATALEAIAKNTAPTVERASDDPPPVPKRDYIGAPQN